MNKIIFFLIVIPSIFIAQVPEYTSGNLFRQLNEEFSTPNVYRNGAGAPGHQYYQNTADYKMEIILDDQHQKISGNERITYHNASPDELTYLWLQLDQNKRNQNSDSYKISTSSLDNLSWWGLNRLFNDFEGGFNITKVVAKEGNDLKYTINKTMMRIDLPQPLKPGASFSFSIDWWYNINNRMEIGGRSGYEYFEKDGNYLYTIAQFYPRMCVYNDVEGWQNKQFLGAGEFTVPFGNYSVSLTVPSDHVVTATGVLQNAVEILNKTQLARLEEARKEQNNPVFIITEKEARSNEKQRQKATKTWKFTADNVRDFAWASSRKFIWDAMVVKQEKSDVLAMSFYPKEGNPLWEQYSTKAVAHTLKTYSSKTFDYPYPVAISVHSKDIGMEYPMICFNGGRPEDDGTYSDRTKYGMISVIIHEVGHNYFPMIVNSDERQWTWMDEGLNTFLQYVSEQEWDRDYPSRRGPARHIVHYMKGDKNFISPIMTNSESIHQFGNNAYGKPATALNILRETIMGRELFDFAFKTYAQRWMFKHPTPEDFFRTMEDASGVDLDWFWRGWFYTTNHVDISLDGVKWYQLSTQDPITENAIKKSREETQPLDVSTERNKKDIPETYIEKDKSLIDFYNTYDPYKASKRDQKRFEEFKANLEEKDKKIMAGNYNFYELSFSNLGGLVMPLIIEFTFLDNSTEIVRIPAEIWKTDNYHIKKVFPFQKEIKSVSLDPFLETADTETQNNHWPKKVEPTRFDLFKEKEQQQKNTMQLNND